MMERGACRNAINEYANSVVTRSGGWPALRSRAPRVGADRHVDDVIVGLVP